MSMDERIFPFSKRNYIYLCLGIKKGKQHIHTHKIEDICVVYMCEHYRVINASPFVCRHYTDFIARFTTDIIVRPEFSAYHKFSAMPAKYRGGREGGG